MNLRLAAAFESHWGSTLLTTIAVASATTTGAAAAAAAADEFKRWRSIVQTFTAWEYDPDPPAARAFTKARTAPVVGALGDVGYGWRVVGSRVGGSSTVRGRDYSSGGSGSNSAIASSEDEEEEEEEDEEEDKEGDKKASVKGGNAISQSAPAHAAGRTDAEARFTPKTSPHYCCYLCCYCCCCCRRRWYWYCSRLGQ